MAYRSILTQGGDEDKKPKRPYKANIDAATGKVSIGEPVAISDRDIEADETETREAGAKTRIRARMDDKVQSTSATALDDTKLDLMKLNPTDRAHIQHLYMLRLKGNASRGADGGPARPERVVE